MVSNWNTYRFDNSIESHQNLADFDQKNIRFAADQNIVIFEPDRPAVCPEIDLEYVIVFQILSHLPRKSSNE